MLTRNEALKSIFVAEGTKQKLGAIKTHET